MPTHVRRQSRQGLLPTPSDPDQQRTATRGFNDAGDAQHVAQGIFKQPEIHILSHDLYYQ